MDSFKRQAVILALLDSMKRNDSWCGETHLQKCAFFLERGLKVPLDLGFVLYKYGPFSFDLRELLGEMRANFLLSVEPRAPYGPSLVVSESGKALMERFPKTIRENKESIEFVSDKLGSRSVAELERLGTALYVQTEWPGLEGDIQVQRLVELKPHVQVEQAQNAVKEVERLLQEARVAGVGSIE
jgi:hypothetical protein